MLLGVNKRIMYNISLKNNVSFNCTEEDTLVAAAKRQGVTLEHSCLLGRCSSCKVKVQSGSSVANMDESTLSRTEKKNGYILSCVRSPQSDMVLSTEDLSQYNIPLSKTMPVKIQDVTKYGNDIIKVVLRFPPSQKFEFLNGQYVNIIKGSIKRSYSIANENINTNTLDFFIKNYNGGAMSNYWFNEAKKDDLLRIEGPKGTFFRRTQDVNHLIFLATGTGIAPVKSILENIKSLNKEGEFSNIYLFWGNRYDLDFFWDPREIDLPLTYFPVLSRERKYMVERGYIQDILLSKAISLDKTAVYACGSDRMISEAQEKLIKKGLQEENFFSDAFVTTN